MPQPCTVCHHPRLEEINTALVSGTPRLRIAKTFGLKEPAVRYHAGRHLPEYLGLAHRASEVATADRLLEKVRRTVGRLESLVDKADASGDPRTMLLAVRELRPWLELMSTMDRDRGEESLGHQGAHKLAREAERYLGWYQQQFPGRLAAPEGGSVTQSRLDSDRFVEIDVPEGLLEDS